MHVFYIDLTPSMKPTLRRWGGLSNQEVSASASTRRDRWSDAASFDENEQIFLSTLSRTGFSIEVCSYFNLSQLDFDPYREYWRMKQIGSRCSSERR